MKPAAEVATPEETYSTDGPQCPKCSFTITPDEGHYYDARYTDEECPECNHKFTVRVDSSTSWTCRPKDVEPPDPPGFEGGFAANH